MKSDINNIYFLTQQEYLVLAAITGLDSIRGVFIKNEKSEFSEEDVYYACFGLMRKGALDDRRAILEPYRRLFARIKTAPLQLFAHGFKEYAEDTVYAYLALESCIVSRVSHSDEGAICLYEADYASFFRELEEENFLPDIDVHAPLSRTPHPVSNMQCICWTDDEERPIKSQTYSAAIKGELIVKRVETDEKIGWAWMALDESEYMARISEDSQVDLFNVTDYMSVLQQDLGIEI